MTKTYAQDGVTFKVTTVPVAGTNMRIVEIEVVTIDGKEPRATSAQGKIWARVEATA